MVLRSFFDYIRSSVAELKKVDWPTRREVVSYTLIILVSVVIATLTVSVVDYGLSLLVDRFLIN
jgi:preprotein translocase subunit SecE